MGKTVAGGNRAFVLSAQETENSGRRFIRSRVGPDRTAYDAEAGMYTLRKVPVLTGRPRADIDRPPVESVELSLAVPKSDTSSYMGKYVLNTKVSLYIDGDWH
ncbi:MAG TPA: hypothetical protein VLF43_03755 [Candidatus Saccharimonadales bacterium]|nr:hypothetical protein [Candidatus Saccharimonadales bacterium]